MKISVHYRDSAHQKVDEQIEISDMTTVQELIDRFDSFNAKTVVIKGIVVWPDFVIEEGSDVYLFPQMSGG